MSATLKTQNYQLPYFSDTDNTDWSAYNDSMQKIDTQLFANAGSTASATEQISAVQASVATINNTLQTQGNRIGNLETNVATAQSNINLINQTDLEQNQKIEKLEAAAPQTANISYTNPSVNVSGITFNNFYIIRQTIETGFTDSLIANPQGLHANILGKYQQNMNSENIIQPGSYLFYQVTDNTYNGKRWTIQHATGKITPVCNNQSFNFNNILPRLFKNITTQPIILNYNDQLFLGAYVYIDGAPFESTQVSSLTYYIEFDIFFEITNN